MNHKFLTASILSAGLLLLPTQASLITSAQAQIKMMSKKADDVTPEKLKNNIINCIGKLKGFVPVDPKTLKAKKKTSLGLYFTAGQAYAHLKKNKETLLIDVRTPEETMFIGMPKIAAKNIPYMIVDTNNYSEKKQRYKMKRNKNFAKEADAFIKSKNLDEFSTIIVMCRSGGRSAKAVEALAEAGYDNVYTIVDGFEGDKDKNKQRTVNGWKNSQLPWTYKIAPTKSYRMSMAIPMTTAAH